jgi:hypothetical protein
MARKRYKPEAGGRDPPFAEREIWNIGPRLDRPTPP